MLSILAACGIGAVLYDQTKVRGIAEAKRQIADLLLEHRALHLYIQRDAHPALYRAKDEGNIARDFYAPEFLSSSYMVRNLHGYLNEARKEEGRTEVYYKMAAANPRNPVNMADALETDLIRMFNADRGTKEYREVVEVDGKKYLYYARPFLQTNEACLKCHGDRQSAPKQLQARYQGSGGFGDKEGNIRAIESIRIPIQSQLATAQIVSIAMAVAGLGMAGLMLVNGRLKSAVRTRTAKLEKEVAERKRTEKALREGEERLQAILDTIHAGVLLIDIDTHVVVDANAAALRMIGASREQVVGQVCHEYLCPGDVERCPITDLGESTDNSERVLVTAEGDSLAILKTVTPITLDGRTLLLESFIDISEQKEAEEQLRKNVAELEEFNSLAIGREERMIGLKQEVNAMAERAGVKSPYDLSFIPTDKTGVTAGR
ncbi:MAG: DUF3365 domain-containing protein [Phycisphaerales bacterium]|nr:MAG: DUF3365 domain-containing protein [Phycisphaerales bacterium]